MSLESKTNSISLPRWLAMGFEKAFPVPQSFLDRPQVMCTYCEAVIVDKQMGLQLKNCSHHLHKTCLEDLLTTKSFCPDCEQPVLLGYSACLNDPKLKEKQIARNLVQAGKKKKKTMNLNN